MSVVKITKHQTAKQGSYVGQICLNRPEALNALNLAMLDIIHETLIKWQNDASVVAVWIESSGSRAFCAGGDVIALYNGMQVIKQKQVNNEYDVKLVPENLKQFFNKEYEVDFMIHTYPKPVIAWGNGYIMGGGMGIYAGADFKIGTTSTRIAMPENSIGLFPDVGASYFLNKLPAGVGLFLGLSGVQVNAQQARQFGLITHILDETLKAKTFDALCQLKVIKNDVILSMLQTLEQTNDEQANDLDDIPNDDIPNDEFEVFEQSENLSEFEAYLTSLNEKYSHCAWLQKASSLYFSGSPLARKITFRQLSQGRGLNAASCFQMETNIVYRALFEGEFSEGVRALLIDKDKSPQWRYHTINDVPDTVIEQHFSFFNASDNPLVGLEKGA